MHIVDDHGRDVAFTSYWCLILYAGFVAHLRATFAACTEELAAIRRTFSCAFKPHDGSAILCIAFPTMRFLKNETCFERAIALASLLTS